LYIRRVGYIYKFASGPNIYSYATAPPSNGSGGSNANYLSNYYSTEALVLKYGSVYHVILQRELLYRQRIPSRKLIYITNHNKSVFALKGKTSHDKKIHTACKK